jgi:hypothetical protein
MNAKRMKINNGVFWSVMPWRPDEGSAKFLRNIGSFMSHTALTSYKTPFFIATAMKTTNLAE